MREECWAGGGRAKFFFTRKRGASSTFRLKFALPSRFKQPREAADPGSSFFLFQEACPDLFPSRALPAAGCDSKLSLGSGVQSSELSRQSSWIQEKNSEREFQRKFFLLIPLSKGKETEKACLHRLLPILRWRQRPYPSYQQLYRD